MRAGAPSSDTLNKPTRPDTSMRAGSPPRIILVRHLAGNMAASIEALAKSAKVTATNLGYITLSDRAKDVIKSGGEWISSVYLENALMGHPDVVEAAVCATDVLGDADELAAAVVLRPGASATDGELRRHVGARLPAHMRPARIVVADALPRLPSARLDRNGVR